MSVARSLPSAYKRLGSNGHGPRTLPRPLSRPPRQRSRGAESPADFTKVDAILHHLQQTESQDWIGEISHCCTQVGYLLLQNYNISRFNFYNYNFHLTILTALFFAQRIWMFLWRVTQLSDAHGLRFACHMVLFFVVVDSLYCGLQLILKDSFVGSLYLATPLVSTLLFHQVYLKTSNNVFTAELFSMLGRCVYHSFESAYCVGVLPLRFLQHEYIYFDVSRCMVLASFMVVHSFLSLLCLELHCLGSEVLQQACMLGEWRCLPDLSRLRTISPKPAEWSCQNCPYPRGAVVRCKGQYYEAMGTLNTCTPTSPPQCINSVSFVLGDSQRTKTLMLCALLLSTAALVPLILCSTDWTMYAVLLIPNCSQFLYVKYRSSHAFFNPAHLNLRHLQWDLNVKMPLKLNGQSGPFPTPLGSDRLAGGWGAYGEDNGEDNGDGNYVSDALWGKPPGNGCRGDGFADLCPNPLLVSAVTAATAFFFGPSGTARSPSEDGASCGPARSDT